MELCKYVFFQLNNTRFEVTVKTVTPQREKKCLCGMLSPSTSSRKDGMMWEKTHDRSFLDCVLLPTGITGIQYLTVYKSLKEGIPSSLLWSVALTMHSLSNPWHFSAQFPQKIEWAFQQEGKMCFKYYTIWKGIEVCFFPKGINQVYLPFPSLRFKIASWSLKRPNNKNQNSRKNTRKKTKKTQNQPEIVKQAL